MSPPPPHVRLTHAGQPIPSGTRHCHLERNAVAGGQGRRRIEDPPRGRRREKGETPGLADAKSSVLRAPADFKPDRV